MEALKATKEKPSSFLTSLTSEAAATQLIFKSESNFHDVFKVCKEISQNQM